MTFRHLLAVLPVSEIDTAARWYEKLIGRPPDNNPMPVLVEWQVLPNAWLQVTVDPQRAGTGLFNLAVDDLDGHTAELRAKGIEAGDVQQVNKGVAISTLHDPDGNTITLIGNFRERY